MPPNPNSKTPTTNTPQQQMNNASAAASSKEGDDHNDHNEETKSEDQNNKEKHQQEKEEEGEEEESPTSTTSEDKNSFVSKVVLPDPSTWTDIGDDIEQFDKLVTHDFPIQDGVNGLSPPSSLMETVMLSDVEIAKNATMTDVFKVCYDDEAEFAFEYRKKRPTVPDTDTVMEAWRPPPTTATSSSSSAENTSAAENTAGTSSSSSSSSSSVSGGIRTMTCNSTIRALTTSICKYTEFQRFLLCKWKKQPTLIVQFSGQAPGPMFCDCFRAETMMIYTPSKTQPNNIVCSAYFHINFISAPYFFAGLIKSSAFSQTSACFETFFKVGNQCILEEQSKSSASSPSSSSSSPGKKKTPTTENSSDVVA